MAHQIPFRLILCSTLVVILTLDLSQPVEGKAKPLYKGQKCEPDYDTRVRTSDETYCARLLYCHPKKRKCVCPPKFKWDPKADFKDGEGKSLKKPGMCLGQEGAHCREGSELMDLKCKPGLKCVDRKKSKKMVNPFHGGPVYEGKCG